MYSINGIYSMKNTNNEEYISRLNEIIMATIGKDKGGQRLFAEKCGIPPSTLNRYIKQGQLPKAEYLIPISETSGYHITWLLTGKGSQRITDQPETSELLNRVAHLLAGGNCDAIDVLEQNVKNLERTIEKEKKQQEENEAIRKELAELKNQKCKDGKHCQEEQLPNEKVA